MSEDADLLELIKSTDTAFVIFSSIMGGMAGYQSFEFVRSFENADASLVFVRDVDQVWYQGGFRGLDGGIDGAIAYLRDLRQNHRRLVFAGYSAGAFASILFGEIVTADIALAIAPQASVDQAVMRELGDVRWKPLIENINANYPSDYLDLRDHIEANGRTRTLIVTPGADPLDKAHLSLLKPAFGSREVSLIVFNDCSHRSMLQPLKQSRLVPKLPTLIGMDRSVNTACEAILNECRESDTISLGSLAELDQILE